IVLTIMVLHALPVAAADLAQIERKIVKEAAYQSKPKYCLLVFGPEAKTKIWLVMDGDTLYVDRNGNGDLTEAGKKVAAQKSYLPAEELLVFDPGVVQDGNLRHKIISLERHIRRQPLSKGQDRRIQSSAAKGGPSYSYNVAAEIEIDGRKGPRSERRFLQYTADKDADGLLEFADRPQDAPILHFCGAWQIVPLQRPKFIVGQQNELVLALATRGIGPGTTVWTEYEVIFPNTAYPKVEISFPARKPGEPPVRELYEIKHR